MGEYVEASPVSDGADDATTAFLPPVFASRYPLEAVSQATVDATRAKGMLLPANSHIGVAVAGHLLLAEGFVVPHQPPTIPACRERDLPALRSQLPGYRPAFDYFDTSLPTPPTGAQADYDAVTEGVDLNMALERSRLSCEVLAMAQTWDARHNDLEWTWQLEGDAGYVARRVYGRRAHMSANANRICAWTKLKDRDGAQHLYGLNYQGRPLVDAVLVTIGGQPEWRIAETLYNADGNVLARRRTMPQTTSWTPSSGDTRYQYMDTQKLPDGGVLEPTPCYWSRRGNVVKVVERPRGGFVPDVLESSPSTPDTTKGRYETYEYEPLFNQVLRVRRGVFDAALLRQETSVTTTTFDYQEGAISNIQATLERLQERGCQLEVDAQGVVDPQNAMPWPVAFGVGDLNADGKFANTRLGLPIRVQTTAGGLTEETLYTWNDRARLEKVKGPDGAEAALTYYPVGETTGAAPNQGGQLATIQHRPLKTWSAAHGPPRPGCPHLAGPYQWLLPATCSSSNLAGQLETQLFLPSEAAQHIASQQAATSDGTTTFEYFSTGHLKRLTAPDARVTAYQRDTDGRVTKETTLDGSVERYHVDISYNAQLRPTWVHRYGPSGQDFGAVFRTYDEEGHVLYECQEFAANGCTPPSRGTLPSNGRSATYWYTPEGYLRKTMDAEGAVVDLTRDARGWVTQTALSANGEVSRISQTDFDDDGHPLTRRFGVQGPTATLTETRSYDGLGRLASVIDTKGLRHVLKHSRRDVVVQVQTNNPALGPTVLWTEGYAYDGFARPWRQFTNGTLVREVARRPGGQVYASFSYGKRPVYTTYDADGAPVWSEDDGGEVVQVLTGRPDARVVTSSTIRKQGSRVATTSVVSTLDVLGLPTTVVETGASTGQARLSRPRTLQRNAVGLVESEVDADGATSEFVYDFDGRLTLKRVLRTVGATGYDVSTYTYDRRGGLYTLKDPKGEVTTQQYTGFGELRYRRTDGTPPVDATWEYDVLGRLTRETLGQSDLRYVYFTDGTLKQILDGGDVPLREYTYDALKRLSTAKHWNRGLGFAGSPIAAASRAVVTDFQYDWLGRVSEEGNTIGTRPRRVVTSGYSTSWTPSAPAGVVREVGRADGSSSREDFDTLGRLALLRRTTPGVTSRDSTWGFLGGLETTQASATSGAALTTTTSWDALAQPSRWQTATGSTNVLDVAVLRDAMGRVGSYSQKLWRPTQATPDTEWRGYAFDGMGRLSTVHEAGDLPTTSGVSTHTLTAAQVEALATQVSAATWAYTREDEVGSLLSISHVQGGYAPRFTAPARGPGYQLDTYDVAGTGARTVVHDSAGRMVADGDVAFTWDAFSSLAAVKASGALTEALQYDGLGRLVGRYAGNGNLLDEYVWDGAQLVSSLTSSGSRRWTAYWGAGIDNLVSVSVGGDEYLAVHDGRGSVAALHSVQGNRVVAALDYTPEGRTGWRTFDGNGAETGNCEERDSDATCGGVLGVPFGFHTALKSEGTGLLYFRNRWYSTTAGQWLSRDPLGPVDSHNLYAFNGFDSVNFVDPWGLNKGAAGPAAQGAPPPLDPSGSEFDSGKRTKGPLYPAGGDTDSPGPGGDGGGDDCKGPICEVMGAGPGLGAVTELPPRSPGNPGSPQSSSGSGSGSLEGFKFVPKSPRQPGPLNPGEVTDGLRMLAWVLNLLKAGPATIPIIVLTPGETAREGTCENDAECARTFSERSAQACLPGQGPLCGGNGTPVGDPPKKEVPGIDPPTPGVNYSAPSGSSGGPVAEPRPTPAPVTMSPRDVRPLPSLDQTGKVHGELPSASELGNYSIEELEQLRNELQQSVEQRIRVTTRLGSDKAHGQRQAAEQELIRQIDKFLGDKK